jgi:hypothetical protein
MFQPPGFFAQLFDGCRKAKPRQSRRAQRQERPLAAQRRDLADGIERAGGVALEPVEIEAHGPERNERRQEREGSAPTAVASRSTGVPGF